MTANGAGYEGSGRYTFAEGDNNKNLSCEAKVTSFPDAVIDSASLEVVGELPLIVRSPTSRFFVANILEFGHFLLFYR